MKTNITITGRLTKDPELTFTQQGTALCKFSVARNHSILNKKTQEWEAADTTFFSCQAWDKFAEDIAEFGFTQGQLVIATGEIEEHHWDAEDGTKRSAFSVTVRDMGQSCLYASRNDNQPQGSTDTGPALDEEVEW